MENKNDSQMDSEKILSVLEQISQKLDGLDAISKKLDEVKEETKEIPKKVMSTSIPHMDLEETFKAGKVAYAPPKIVKNKETGEMEEKYSSMGDVRGILSLFLRKIGELEERQTQMDKRLKEVQIQGSELLAKQKVQALMTKELIIKELASIKEYIMFAYESFKHFAERDNPGYEIQYGVYPERFRDLMESRMERHKLPGTKMMSLFAKDAEEKAIREAGWKEEDFEKEVVASILGKNKPKKGK